MSLGLSNGFWSGKRVFVTGHTGFKGSWLVCMLHRLGANVCGYSLPPETTPNAFEAMDVAAICEHHIGDIQDLNKLQNQVAAFEPEIVFHLAAQPLVRLSYEIPVQTIAVNTVGTANLLESCRNVKSIRNVVVITTDKCYDNKEWEWSYRETDPLGGKDPYSASKACAELVTAAYRDSFFPVSRYHDHQVAVASARAGNVFGGGDWARDRLIPDCVQAFAQGEEVFLRMPHSVRPWQHVADALSGYLTLAQACVEQGPRFAQGWNFGPAADQLVTTEEVVQMMVAAWGGSASYGCNPPANAPGEAGLLLLDSGLAARSLKWKSRISMLQGIRQTVEWHKAQLAGADATTLRNMALVEVIPLPERALRCAS